MKVRILSGSLAGQVVVMDRTEAEINLATGFVELVVEPPSVQPAPELEKPALRRPARPGPESK
jgi:hypothetical protein